MHWLLVNARVFLDLGFVDKSFNNLKYVRNIMMYPSCLWPWRTWGLLPIGKSMKEQIVRHNIFWKRSNLKGLDFRHNIWFLISHTLPEMILFFFDFGDSYLICCSNYGSMLAIFHIWCAIVIVLMWSYFFHIYLGWCCSHGWVESYNERPARSRNDDNCWFNKWPGLYISIFLFFEE